MIYVFSGLVDVGDVYRTFGDENDGIKIGNIDVVSYLSDWVTLKAEQVTFDLMKGKATLSSDHRWSASGEEVVWEHYPSRIDLAKSTGKDDSMDRLVIGMEDVLEQLREMDGKEVTLIIFDQDINYGDLPTPIGSESYV